MKYIVYYNEIYNNMYKCYLFIIYYFLKNFYKN